MNDPFIFEWVNRIFLDYSPTYHAIKKLAKEDVSKKLQEEIKSFLEHKHEEAKTQEARKVFFEDPSNVNDESINSIVDAFIRMRSEKTLDEIELKSINDILILFNKWVMLASPSDNLSSLVDTVSTRPKDLGLEEHVEIAKPFLHHAHYPTTHGRELYSSINPESYLALDSEFTFGDKSVSSSYDIDSRPVYKAMRPNL